ncbi:MAG: hypothetical protein CVT92_10090 [Bacteroidetes bacterium HGW-Bacteroidetes-1]|jgi:hypothetical protein|nr:MAG: hypothetical protein CVT92_10090 [Bacteroidetes bacterium HGW-Bacteroidetes-1]
MKKYWLIVFPVVILLFFTACASKKTLFFTQGIRENVESYNIDLKDIQFYTSRKIILERNLTYEETNVSSGKVRFENGQYIERIIIKKNTQGVCKEYNTESIDVAFEQGENRDLTFVHNAKDQYQVSAIEWEKKFGRIDYDTTTYYISPGGEKAKLKIKKEDIYKFKKQERVAPGQSVSTK